ncbi:MAG: patatin-like phospholipase family protein [Bacteroidales bacterium]|nr:patatin-like phospholipase family protein [Bacteroidales bacterium]
MSRSVKYFLLINLILLICATGISKGQTTGLVLSGGGARGLAHIGLIRALEEEGISIDYIAGTSMGAIVGALYSMGYTTGEMTELVTSDNFRRWSTGLIPGDLQFTYKNNEPNSAMINLDIDFREEKPEASLPSHLIPSAVIDFAILRLTCGETAASGGNFDSLMIPFRCVAADIYNKKPYVFRSGNLGNAVRASMAYPLYFEPYVQDSTLLFDGGIYNNFPYDVLVKDFSPDFVIGSKVASRSKRPMKNDIMLQLENMIIQPTDYEIPDSLGYVIDIEINEINLLDFGKADSIIEKGYSIAREQIKYFRDKAGREDPEALADRRAAFRAGIPDLVFKDIFIEGVNDRQREYIRNLVSKRGERIDIKQLEEEFFRLVAEENIRNIYPSAKYNYQEEVFDLYLDVELKGTYLLQAGGMLGLTLYNQAYLGFEYYSLSEIYHSFGGNLYFGKNYSSFLVSHRITVPQKNLLLIDLKLSGSNRNYFTSEITSLFETTVPAYITRIESKLRTSVGTPVKNNSSIRAGLNFSWINDRYYRSVDFDLQDKQDQTQYFYGTARLYHESNTLNRKQFSTQGRYFFTGLYYHTGFERYRGAPGDSLSSQEIFSQSHSWLSYKLNTLGFADLSKKFSLGYMLDLVLSNKGLSNNYTASLIEAYKFEPTVMSKTLFGYSLRANGYLGAGLIPVYHFTDNMKLITGIYLFAPVRKIEKTATGVGYGAYFSELSAIADLSMVYHTPIGPISAGLNYFSGERQKVFLFLNFGYILFNKTGLE